MLAALVQTTRREMRLLKEWGIEMTAFDKAWEFVKYEAVSTGSGGTFSGFDNKEDTRLEDALARSRARRKPRLRLPGLRNTADEARPDDPLVERATRNHRNQQKGPDDDQSNTTVA